MSENKKRKISVGFLKPSKLEENTIYITLLKYDKVYAKFYSNEDFIYPTYDSRGRSRIYESGKFAENTNLPPHFCGGNSIPYEEFLEEIVKKNNGEIEDRRLEDGFKLAGIFSDLEKRIFPDFIYHLKEA